MSFEKKSSTSPEKWLISLLVWGKMSDFQVSFVDMWLVGRLRGQRGECSGGGMNTGSKMEWDRCLWENIGTGKWRRIDQLGRRGCALPACAPPTHTHILLLARIRGERKWNFPGRYFCSKFNYWRHLYKELWLPWWWDWKRLRAEDSEQQDMLRRGRYEHKKTIRLIWTGVWVGWGGGVGDKRLRV